MSEPLWSELPVQERLARKFAMDAAKQNKQRGKVEEPVEGAVGGYVPELVQPAIRVDGSKLPKQVAEVVALLEGRELAIHHAVTLMHGLPYATGQKAGELRKDKRMNYYGIATIDGLEPIVTAYWADSAKFDFGYFGYYDGRRARVTLITSLKNLIKEANDG